MIITALTQPPNNLGNEINRLLEDDVSYEKIILVSAFVASRTILRLRELLLRHVDNNTDLQFTVGIDLNGTSLEVLEELNTWPCDTYIFHNAIAKSTFHPKIYLFQTTTFAIVYVGSNNLTDGGFYTNYEAAVKYEFTLPSDQKQYAQLIEQLKLFIEPQANQDGTVHILDSTLIDTLVARGELLCEAETRKRRFGSNNGNSQSNLNASSNPFAAVPIAKPLAPHQNLTKHSSNKSEKVLPESEANRTQTSFGMLVWRKTLSQSDALQVRAGSAHVGGIRLTQAHFTDPNTHLPIDQTTYFRNLLENYAWEPETGRHRSKEQEHTFIPVRIIILNNDYGVHNFEVSHKPSGEAGQGNYTTILRWGRLFNPIIQNAELTGCIFSLYQTTNKELTIHISELNAL